MTRSTFALASCAALASACMIAPSPAADAPGLPSDGQAAVMFAPGVVSTNDVFASTFTPDGRTVVFTKFSPPRPMMLMSSSLDGGRWTAPATLPFSGTIRDLDPAFSPDGTRLYFSSDRPDTPGDTISRTSTDTWYADRAGDGWSAPRRVAGPANSPAVDMYPSVTRRGVLYFDSGRQPPRRLAYRAEPRTDGGFDEPALLPFAINADSGASNLFVDPDERYVIFGARRAGGAGEMDLYVSRRTSAGWSDARNLGPLVNTAAVEFCPFVSRDGRYLYFTRVETADGRTRRNIFVVRVDGLLRRLQ